MNSRISFCFVLLLLTVFACKPKEKEQPVPVGPYTEGIFVVNEGGFGNGNGSVSFFKRSSKTVENDIFSKANGRPLGDVVQSLLITGGKGYIVVNNSNKVEVVSADDFKSVATISNITMPRYMVTGVSGSKGYLTEWVSFSGQGNVRVIDLNSNTITKTIPVGTLPEKMLVSDGKVYVTNSGDSTVFVISTATDAVIDTIFTAGAPNSIVKDAGNRIWVLCGGKKVYNSDYSINEAQSLPGKLLKLDASGNILSDLSFADKTKSPGSLFINTSGDMLYYSYAGKTYRISTAANALSTDSFINQSFYGFGIDPVDGSILAGKASFVQADYFYRYNTSGIVQDSFKVGIAPNGFAFN